MDDKKIFKQTKNLFLKLKTDPASVIFAEETLDARLLQKLKKSKYRTNVLLYKLSNLAEGKLIFNDDKAPTTADFVDKREIDCSTLYNFNGPFQLIHADAGNIEFL